MAHLRLGDLQKAETYLRRGLQINPKDEDISSAYVELENAKIGVICKNQSPKSFVPAVLLLSVTLGLWVPYYTFKKGQNMVSQALGFKSKAKV